LTSRIEKTKRIHADSREGRTSGKLTVLMTRNLPAPDMRPASSRERSIWIRPVVANRDACGM
jgi:hypothetical protein